jgi:hypothetical protein
MYFLIDLIFLSVVRPLRRRLVALKWVRWLREWVSTLNRYAARAVADIGTDQANRVSAVLAIGETRSVRSELCCRESPPIAAPDMPNEDNPAREVGDGWRLAEAYTPTRRQAAFPVCRTAAASGPVSPGG